MVQIGSDGGLLMHPVCLGDSKKNSLKLTPAERADVLIDFSGFAGQSVTLMHDTDYGLTNKLPKVMQFRVSGTPASASATPTQFCTDRPLPTIHHYAESDAVKRRQIYLMFKSEPFDGTTRVKLLINDKPWSKDPSELTEWTDPIQIKPELNTIEVWEIYNLSRDPHPFHVHLVQFQVLNRQKIINDGDHAPQLTGNPCLPAEIEGGRKDTVVVPHGCVTRIIAKFEGYTGTYVYHCHLLEHEDHEMMRLFTVISS